MKTLQRLLTALLIAITLTGCLPAVLMVGGALMGGKMAIDNSTGFHPGDEYANQLLIQQQKMVKQQMLFQKQMKEAWEQEHEKVPDHHSPHHKARS